jgi:hypothetical protein
LYKEAKIIIQICRKCKKDMKNGKIWLNANSPISASALPSRDALLWENAALIRRPFCFEQKISTNRWRWSGFDKLQWCL